MATKYNAPKSDYNKDEHFASLSIDETLKITLREAVAKDTSDKVITVYGYAETGATGIEKMGDTSFKFTEQLVKFSIPKTSYTTEYNGKKKEYQQSPGMKGAIHFITQHGFDKPFSAMFDFGMALPLVESLISGINPSGTPLTEVERNIYETNFLYLKPLEKLEKLEGIEIKDANGKGGYGRGGGGQKESEKLADRLAFIKAQMLPDSELAVILASYHVEGFDKAQQAVIEDLLSNLFN
ncbi:MAG: hypothetical protein KME45_23220 [Stenomitos rutilans HA7619-LM2]|jgi:5'-3' exonuclease|nr:hypothetical protein [Stenomitos rutilans HA7619-LM2]